MNNISTINIPFSQDELKLILSHLHRSLQADGIAKLGLGDVIPLAALTVKLDSHITKEIKQEEKPNNSPTKN